MVAKLCCAVGFVGVQVIARCRRHTEPIQHLDFSQDSEWLQSNCLGTPTPTSSPCINICRGMLTSCVSMRVAGNRLCFLSAEKGTFNSDTSAMKDVQWATQTCTMGWPTQVLHSTQSSPSLSIQTRATL